MIEIDHGGGTVTQYLHLSKMSVQVRKGVKKGDTIGAVGSTGNSTGPHLHFGLKRNGTLVDPEPWLDGSDTQDGGAAVPGDDATQATLAQIAGVAKASAFATFIAVPGIMDMAESMALRGERSLLNDQPLMPFVQQLCAASLRNFQSLPDGGFFAFFPDYFGGLNHRTPYWEIEDIEILNGEIDLSDDSLATHVYVVGDIANFDGVNLFDKIQSGGVATVFTAFQADFLSGNPTSATSDQTEIEADPYHHGPLAGKPMSDNQDNNKYKDDSSAQININNEQAINFLKKYGARPYFEEAPMIRSPYFEAFLAYQKFMLMWSRQFVTTFEFTYMPELYPGGIVSFPRHGIQCYIDSVSHVADFGSGFHTTAQLSAPAAITRNQNGQTVRTGNLSAHEGMIRAGSMAMNKAPTVGNGPSPAPPSVKGE